VKFTSRETVTTLIPDSPIYLSRYGGDPSPAGNVTVEVHTRPSDNTYLIRMRGFRNDGPRGNTERVDIRGRSLENLEATNPGITAEFLAAVPDLAGKTARPV
jgi:hypothetical protein